MKGTDLSTNRLPAPNLDQVVSALVECFANPRTTINSNANRMSNGWALPQNDGLLAGFLFSALTGSISRGMLRGK